MASRTSSAEPDALIHYAEAMTEHDHRLQTTSRQLRGTLERFEGRCREPGVRVSAVSVADGVRAYGSQCEPTDGWVGDVGRRFQMADQLALGASPVAAQSAALVDQSQPGRSTGLWQAIRGIPPWLSSRIDGLSWTAKSSPGALGGQADFLSAEFLHDTPGLNFGNLLVLGREHKFWPERRGRPRAQDRDLKARVALVEANVGQWERKQSAELGGVRLGEKIGAEFLEFEAGAGLNVEKGRGTFGGYIGGTLASTGFSYVLGDTSRGVGAGLDVTVGEAEAFAGYKDGQLGVKAGVNLLSTEGTVGANIAGWNIGLVGGIGAKLELGLEVGEKSRVYLGPFTVGISIGEALGS